MSTFVSLGNALQPFGRLLEEISRILARLPQPVVVQHGHTPFCDRRCQLVPFLSMDEFIRHVYNADVLIMHAGAGSVIHAIEAGKIPVVVPRRAAFGEHVNDHQVEFARELLRLGRIVVADSPNGLASAVEESLLRQRENSRAHENMHYVEPRMVSLVREALEDYARSFQEGRD